MRQAKRVLKPQVINVFDNAVVQVQCIPEEDEIDVASLLGHSLARFEFGIGTSFDLQFLSMDKSQLFGVRRYIVNEVKEGLDVHDINHYQTMSKTVYGRKCSPIGDLIVFHEEGEILRQNLEGGRKAETKKDTKLEDMNAGDLQGTMKQLRGTGFPVGTKKDTMVEAIRKHLTDDQITAVQE